MKVEYTDEQKLAILHRDCVHLRVYRYKALGLPFKPGREVAEECK